MGADHDIQRAVGHALDSLRDFLAGAETRQFGDFYRPVGKAVGESLRVLLCQQGSWRQDRDLFAAKHSDKRRAQRDLGLAEADIAANQPIHRFAAGHILDHGIDRRGLIDRFFKAKTFRESLVVVGGVFECMTLA